MDIRLKRREPLLLRGWHEADILLARELLTQRLFAEYVMPGPPVTGECVVGHSKAAEFSAMRVVPRIDIRLFTRVKRRFFISEIPFSRKKPTKIQLKRSKKEQVYENFFLYHRLSGF